MSVRAPNSFAFPGELVNGMRAWVYFQLTNIGPVDVGHQIENDQLW